MIKTYEVGKRYSEAAGHSEVVLFDITDGGIILPLYFYKPDKQEIAELDASKPVRMSFLTKENVLIIVVSVTTFPFWESALSIILNLSSSSTCITTALLAFEYPRHSATSLPTKAGVPVRRGNSPQPVERWGKDHPTHGRRGQRVG